MIDSDLGGNIGGTPGIGPGDCLKRLGISLPQKNQKKLKKISKLIKDSAMKLFLSSHHRFVNRVIFFVGALLAGGENENCRLKTGGEVRHWCLASKRRITTF
jgi:hypothetical protein